jgi:hypothetical protein
MTKPTVEELEAAESSLGRALGEGLTPLLRDGLFAARRRAQDSRVPRVRS